MRISNRKSGETLLEVVISLSILATVLGATINLTARALNLAVSSRDDTQAVAMAQKGIARGIIYLNSNCTFDDGMVEQVVPVGESSNASNSYKDLVVKVDVLDPSEEDASVGLTTANFRKIIAEVTWHDKNQGDRSYKMQQIIRK